MTRLLPGFWRVTVGLRLGVSDDTALESLTLSLNRARALSANLQIIPGPSLDAPEMV